jgi:hypothetical protein
MPQWFRLDPPIALAYLALGLAGCTRSQPALVPSGMQAATAEQASAWVGATAPRTGALHRFRWLYEDEKSSKGGRGSARIAVPDTLRFDIAGSLGIGKGSAFVVGDTALWVVPERSVQDLVPSFPLLWAMFGVARAPGAEDRLAGLETEGRTAWQYANGPDTVNYLRVAGNPVTFYSEVRHAGKVTGRTQMTTNADGVPLKAKLTVPSVPAKLEITFYATVPTPAFPAETWTRPSEP